MKQYVMLGVGYVAPKHMKAIKETGGDLIACLDPHDSVGILDSYFPDCKYFNELERFDQHCVNQEIDYVVICSPNNCHFEQCVWAMKNGMGVICEKPTILTVGELEKLIVVEQETGNRVWSILQLRLSDAISELRAHQGGSGWIDVKYHVPRGPWYTTSWKGSVEKSGGLATAIGIHLFDLLLLLFGPKYRIISWYNSPTFCEGNILIGGYSVKVELSIEWTDEPIRLFSVNGVDFELSKNFVDLHTLSYDKILAGSGVGLEDVRLAIKICEQLRGW